MLLKTCDETKLKMPMRTTRISLAFVAAMCLSSIVACAQVRSEYNPNWRQNGYDAQSETIGRLVREQKMSITEANQQMVLIARNYFPNDPLLITAWKDLADLAQKADNGEITWDQYHSLRKMRWEIFDDANRNRHAESAAIEAQRQQALFFSRALDSVGRSLQQNNPPILTCQTTRIPGVVTTNCQ